MESQISIPVIAGVTSSGKTNISESLAIKIQGEIINADSRAIYRNIRIGTARYEMSSKVRYHLVDILDLDETYSAYKYVIDARNALDEILKREMVPILSGGTHHFIERLISGFDEVVPKDKDLRRKYYKMAEQEGCCAVHDHLKKADPEIAASIHPHDIKRSIRGLERSRYKSTGFLVPPLSYPSRVFFLEVRRDILKKRIRERTWKMIENGWIDEVVTLRKMGYDPSLPGIQAIGYGAIFEHLENRIDLDDVVEKVVRDTFEYARKQSKWARRLKARVIDRTGLSDMDVTDILLDELEYQHV